MLADWQKLSAPLKRRNEGHLNGLYIPFEGISERFRISHMGAIETRNTSIKKMKKVTGLPHWNGCSGHICIVFLARP